MGNLMCTISSHEESPTSTTERHFCVPFCFRFPFCVPLFCALILPSTPFYCAHCQRFLFRAVGRAVINAHVLAKRVAAHPWNEEGGKHHFSTATCCACAYFLHGAPRLSAHTIFFFFFLVPRVSPFMCAHVTLQITSKHCVFQYSCPSTHFGVWWGFLGCLSLVDGDHGAVSTPALSYVAAVASDAARAWDALCGNGDGSGAAAANSANSGAHRNCWVVPIVARDAVWSEAVQVSWYTRDNEFEGQKKRWGSD